METQVMGKKPWKPYNNSFLAKTIRRKQPPYYNEFKSPATIGRSLQPFDLYATTRRRLQPPFLASSCHLDMKIEIAESRLH